MTGIMTELILRECMEKAQADYDSSLTKPKIDVNVKIKLSKEHLKELRNNAYSGSKEEDEIDHIAKVLEILDSIKIPNVDTDRLRMHVFPVSLTGATQEWSQYGDLSEKKKRILVEYSYSGILCVVVMLVPISDTTQDNYVLDQSIQKMYYSEQPAFDHTSDIEITSDRNIISYDQYTKEIKSEVVQDTISPEQQNDMIMYVIDEMSNQDAKCDVENIANKSVSESLTTELERYKEQIKMFEERQKVDLTDREKYIDSQMRDDH
ncbi:hypothetical protein Tco_0388707 [Tanacetum coccineum]